MRYRTIESYCQAMERRCSAMKNPSTSHVSSPLSHEMSPAEVMEPTSRENLPLILKKPLKRREKSPPRREKLPTNLSGKFAAEKGEVATGPLKSPRIQEKPPMNMTMPLLSQDKSPRNQEKPPMNLTMPLPSKNKSPLILKKQPKRREQKS